jgi:hypothetical protein
MEATIQKETLWEAPSDFLSAFGNVLDILKKEGLLMNQDVLPIKSKQPLEYEAIQALNEEVAFAFQLYQNHLNFRQAVQCLEKIQVAEACAQRSGYMTKTPRSLRCGVLAGFLAEHCRRYFHSLKHSRTAH